MFLFAFFGLFGISAGIQVTPEPGSSIGYHDYHQMTQFLREIAYNFSDLTALYSIGKSVEQRDLWVLRISAPKSPILGVPHIKFIGNIHGNEPVGREVILQWAEYLVKNYDTDADVRWILDKTVIHLLPSLNPDGFEKSKEGDCYSGPGRENGNFVDLNRSFPDHFRENKIPAQPETLAIAQWMSQVPFVLSASFHGGALVANYPFDSNPENDMLQLWEDIMRNISNGENLMDVWKNLTPNGSTRVIILHERDLLTPRSSITPDDDVFRHLAQTYSSNHLTMHKGRTCNENQPIFPGGITNGAAWYSFSGGMQDYNYVSHGCMELTLEISCCKYPQAFHLPRLWSENKKALLEFSKQAHVGVRGLVLDKLTSNYISGALLQIFGRNIRFTSSKNGEFWRILLPGDYVLTVEAKGYETQHFPFTVPKMNNSNITSTWLNIYLQPIDDMMAEASSNNVEVIANSANVLFTCFPVLFCFSILVLIFKNV